MSRQTQRQELLVDQREALWEYLDGLLREIPETDDEQVSAPEPVRPAPVLVPAPQVTPVEPVVDPEPAPIVDTAVEVEEAPTEEEPRPEGACPAWAEPDFQALLFEVGRLRLAVPLIKLQSVVPWNDQITGMPNQPRWCHGLMRYRERNVRVIDTAELVLPPDKRDVEIDNTQILIVGDGRWGLTCSRIGEVIRLTPQEVKWRAIRGQRPWLAGTVLGHLCALMDTAVFADMLDGEI